jgi:hypothetical protein
MARLRLRFVNSFRDRHGRMRDYFRRPGCKAIPLPGLPCSAEYIEAYQAALAGVPVLTREVGASCTQPGTINAAIVAYYKHPMFTEALAPATQTMRPNVLERFRAEHGDKRLSLLQRIHIVKLLERMKPHAQKNWLNTLRGLMAFAVANGLRADDPSEGVKPLRVATSVGHMTWLEPQITVPRASQARHRRTACARTAAEHRRPASRCAYPRLSARP